MSKRGLEFYLIKTANFVVLVLIILAVLFTINREALVGQLCLYQVLPGYEMENTMEILFAPSRDSEQIYAEAAQNRESAEAFKIEDTNMTNDTNEVLGLDDVVYQHENTANSNPSTENLPPITLTSENFDALRDINTLERNFYTVDESTAMTPDLFNVDNFMTEDLKITPSDKKPKVLIFHTHSHEKYVDSKDTSEGVIGVGEELKRVLEEKYGIIAIHDTSSYDVVDGKSQIMGAYERMEPEIEKILEENPSIEVVIDIHRDGVPETTKLVTEINGKPTAKIMFFNGISKIYENGELVDISSLPNEYLDTNLAFSFNMQLAANEMYPGFARKIYVNAYRYSLNMKPMSLLVEVGAQTNTKEEAYNAAEPLADILAKVILQ